MELPQWLETQKYDPVMAITNDVDSGGLNIHIQPLLTIPVRSSNNKAPRLHQSQASVILDTPPISVHIQ